MKKLLLVGIIILSFTRTASANKIWEADCDGFIEGWGNGMAAGGPEAALVDALATAACFSLAAAFDELRPAINTSCANPTNPYDIVGVHHNLILTDYLRKYKTFSTGNYLRLINSNYQKYGLAKGNIPSQSALDRSMVSAKASAHDLTAKLPQGLDKNQFNTALQQIRMLNSNNMSDFNRKEISIENEYLKHIPEKFKQQMGSFFAILRFSANFSKS